VRIGLLACAVSLLAGRVSAQPEATPAVPDTGSGAPVPASTDAPAAPAPAISEEPTGPERTFAGSIQLDYLLVPTESPARRFTLDGATAELSLKLNVDLSPHMSTSVKVCFACHGFEAAMASVDVRASEAMRLRIGRLTPAFGSFPARHDPANHRTSDKPLPYDMGRMLRREDWNEGVLPAPWIDNGVELGGTYLHSRGQLDYAAYIIAGPRGDVDAADFDFRQSRSGESYYVDNNSRPVIGGRISGLLELGERGSVAAGASMMAGTYDPDARLSFWIAGIDATVVLDRVTLRSEYLVRRTEMAPGTDPATRFKYAPGANGFFFLKQGFYLEAEVPLGRVEMLARFDGLRRVGNVLASSALTDKTSVYRYTAGIAVRVGTARLKSSIELYDFSDFAYELATHLGFATPF
jgi:hypothetical protein